MPLNDSDLSYRKKISALSLCPTRHEARGGERSQADLDRLPMRPGSPRFARLPSASS
jgi:hypothetical protein